MSERYFALQASLPPLPYFATAVRLPISDLRIGQRRSLLTPDDRRALETAMDLVRWRRQLPEASDQRVALMYRRFMQECQNEELKAFVQFRAGLRAVMAALRSKRRHQEPRSDQLCGFGHWDYVIRKRWHEPDLGLSHVFPWIGEAHHLLESGDALALEKLLMDAVWNRLQPLNDAYPFRFEAIFAYIFKWDILARWLGFNADGARARFAAMLGEVYGDYRIEFN
jgi:hypothetical protein